MEKPTQRLSTELRLLVRESTEVGKFFYHVIVALPYIVTVMLRCLVRIIFFSFEVILEGCLGFFRFLWKPKFWHSQRYKKSWVPDPAFDVAVISSMAAFALLGTLV